MDSVSAFLDMGGYAAFVWPCFGLVALVMVWIFVASQRELKRRERRVERLRALSPRRRRQATEAEEGAS
jgi:heme exporter protein D